MTKLLINESPLVVLPSLAVAIGLNEAIVLQQIQYWISQPTGGRNVDGVKWIWNSLHEWKAQFPFWSERKIMRLLKNLKDRNLIFVSQMNKAQWDRTNFYTINLQALAELELNDTPKQNITDTTKTCSISVDKPEPSSYTETTTEITTENKKKDVDEKLTLADQNELKPNDTSEGLWVALVKVRKERKAVQTTRGINAVIRELGKCEAGGVSKDEAIEVYLENKWVGLKADWVLKDKLPKKKLTGAEINAKSAASNWHEGDWGDF